MLSFAIILAVCSTAFEMIIAAKWDWWRTKAAHNLLVCGVGSILLSYVVGTAFGAHGLISMTAGIMSTVMSAMCYPVLEYFLSHKEGFAQARTKVSEFQTNWSNFWEKNRQMIADFGRLIMFLVRIVTIPFRLIRWVSEKYNTLHRPAQPIYRSEQHP